MRPFGCSLLAILLATAHAAPAAGPPEPLLKKLHALAGADAQDCGSIGVHGDRAAVIACAQGALASGKAYRLTVELQGGDFSWQGAARDDAGKLWVVFYGADAAEGAAAPSLSLVLCREIRFSVESGEDALECMPSIGGH